MPTRYLVLRATRPIDKSLDLTDPAHWLSPSAPENLELTVLNGHEGDRERLSRDPTVAALSRSDVRLTHIGPTTPHHHTHAPGVVSVGAVGSPWKGAGVTVAVLDSGIDDAHPAFSGKTLVKKNFSGFGAPDDVRDNTGHGTHCAGTICGGDVQGTRIGVAPGVSKLCVAKVLSGDGCTIDVLADALLWAVREQQANLVNLSFAYDLPGELTRLIQSGVSSTEAGELALRDQADISNTLTTLLAFLHTRAQCLVLIGAAGNNSQRPFQIRQVAPPASLVFPVGAAYESATDAWDVADFSNEGVKLAAPGVNVVSAWPGGGLQELSGTSMAAPHVTGVAALWMEKLLAQGGLSTAALEAELLSRATKEPFRKPAPSFRSIGNGLVQAPR